MTLLVNPVFVNVVASVLVEPTTTKPLVGLVLRSTSKPLSLGLLWLSTQSSRTDDEESTVALRFEGAASVSGKAWPAVASTHAAATVQIRWVHPLCIACCPTLLRRPSHQAHDSPRCVDGVDRCARNCSG
ncbi:MAG TPA: hypothetical protein VNO26_05685 [Candidatus Limnocylindria bacterium]|nr:hypothetical protein [Candidatus Limnocylindria bacterium]